MGVRIRITRWNIFKVQTRRVFTTLFTLVSMATVALLSALITMRLSIHASVEEVPNLAGMTLDEAAQAARKAGLNLTLENRFYSVTVPSGHVLSQSPAPGTKVRSDWYIRVTESTGPQKVAIPDTVGKNARDAAMQIRRAQLDLGTVAHLPAPGESELVLAQTPPPNAEGVDKPQVSVLLSTPEASGDDGYVMPNLVGLSLREAQKRMSSAGLRVAAIAPAVQESTIPAIPQIPKITAAQVAGQLAPVAIPVAPVTPPVAVPTGGTVTSQSPQPGFRVGLEDVAKLYLNGARPQTSASAPATPAQGGTVSVPVPAQ